jgi:hypothetical protein
MREFTQNRPDRSLKPKQRAPQSAWAEQAEKWTTPTREFTCCEIVFRAMTPESLLLLRNAHQERH